MKSPAMLADKSQDKEKYFMKKPSHYLKMRVLGAVDFAEGKSIRERIRQVSQRVFEDERGRPWRFTWRTIESWRLRYRKHGFTGLESKPRSDKGSRRKAQPEQVYEAIQQILPSLRGQSRNKSQIYRACLEKGILLQEDIAASTFSRMVKEHELLKPPCTTGEKKRLAFCKEFSNEMWQGDTMYGPYTKDGAKPRQTYLIAFIDDASRVVPHAEFFFHENVDSLIATLRTAFYKRGLPQQIYVDNGSIYTSKEILSICARLDILLSHAPVRDGAAKGKIERFFGTVRSNFLSQKLDLRSLEVLNRRFITWLEEHYNAKPHSTLGMKPIDRFGLDLHRIRFLPPNQDTDELFFLEADRQVKKDNTFSLNAIRFQAPRDLRGRKIQVRFDRHKFDKVIVFYKDERMGQAFPLDPVANDRKPKSLQKGNNPS